MKSKPLLLAAAFACALPLRAAEFHVSPRGNDSNAGTSSQPFATLERARDEIRARKKKGGLPPGGVTVTLHAGLYELARTFELTAGDAGTKDSPIVYRARPGDEVRVSGGKRVTAWKPVSDQAVLARLDPAARGHVVQADLRAAGVSDFGAISGGFGQRGSPGLELFFNDDPMTLSRYPNEGFIKITAVLGPTAEKSGRGRVEGIVTYDGDRPARWMDEKEPWALGYWFHDWADGRQRIESIDPATKRMTLAKPHHTYGYRQGKWFAGFNLLCEIDRPGEWFLDRQAGMIYFWPPTPIDQGRATVSVLGTLVTMTGAAHVTLRGLILEAARGTALQIENAAHNHVAGCTLRNTGSWAVNLSGADSSVRDCEITGTGDGGISLRGGDRQTLTPAGLVAENNHIHHWSRWNRINRQGISLNGVGHRAAHNLLHDSPHTAIFFSGNDHVIELNEIHNVCLESNDAGAIYAGRNWTMRGTVIRHNYLHHLHGLDRRGCIGIYLDDTFSGTTIFGNLFHDVTRAAYIGGGHDNRIENNLFVDCKPAVHVDSRGLGWAHRWPAEWVKEIKEKGTLSGIRYNQPPYSTRYPELPRILEQEPAAPTGSLIARNVQIGGSWDEVDQKAAPYVTFRDNFINADPLIVAAANGRHQLRDGAPAYQAGFERIPVEKMGLVKANGRER
ncbi:MAG: right-handed parallel beta-helix repeat-containing protein [Verrucomicrobiaceae bacterium]|nr:right-handed parallel beta-helix repeat-containing protein [Verrucomicrobiaceae bacterium]